MPRSAVRVTKSRRSIVAELREKAVQLEKRLAADNDREKANSLRIPLCEALSDWLLTDAASACENDVPARLWRHCFYSRITPMRARIHRERQKNERSQEANKMEQSLHFFLTEGITLYLYLCDKLESKLLCSCSPEAAMNLSTASQDSSLQSSHLVGDGNSDNESTEGLVSCLHRLYIHLGDLYRYSSTTGKAEQSYQVAAQLGPGQGHPYNQLAVCCQVQTSSADAAGSSLAAVSVYWYIRALAATCEPFETARSNLRRLCATNAKWIVAQQQQQQESTTQQALSKSVKSRIFLSQFIDLHYRVWPDTTGDNMDDEDFWSRMEDTSERLGQLLYASALGDSLLCKLVSIQAYTEQQQVKKADCVRVRTFTLQVGQRLAAKVLQTLDKGKKGRGPPPSVRVLLPLLLLVEFLLIPGNENQHEKDSANCSEDVIERHDESFEAFWKAIVQIHNRLQDLSSLWPAGDEEDDDDASPQEQLKEYQLLRGFSPFQSFLKPIQEDGLVSDAEAAEVLELMRQRKSGGGGGGTQESGTGRATSQDSSMVGNSGKLRSSLSEHRCKVVCFLALKERLIATLASCVRESTDGLEWFDGQSEEEDEEAYDNGGSAAFAMEDDGVADDKPESVKPAGTGEVALHYEQARGGGPALLVPGALVRATESAPEQTDRKRKMPPPSTRVSASVDQGRAVQELEEPGGLHHFPGTIPGTVTDQQNADVATMSAMPPQAAQLQMASSIPTLVVEKTPIVTAEKATAAPQRIVQPPPGFGQQEEPRHPPSIGQNFDAPLQTFNAPRSSHVPTLMDSFGWCGGDPESLKTANPFATDLLPTIPGRSGSQMARNSDSFAEDEAVGLDGTKLLDSSLLNSLLMDDSPRKTTKNPFAM
jgi:hypothetical protein